MTDRHGRGAVGAGTLSADKVRRRDYDIGDPVRRSHASDATDDQAAMAVARVERADCQSERVSGVRRQFNTPAAVGDVEGRDRLGRRGRRRGRTADRQFTALDCEGPGDIEPETAVHVGGTGVVEGQDPACVHIEAGAARSGRAIEGLTGVHIAEASAVHRDRTRRAGRKVLGRRHRQLALADLLQGDRAERCVGEAGQLAGEDRGRAVEAHDQGGGRGAAVHHLAGPGQRTPDGGRTVEVEESISRKGQRRVARATVGDAGPDRASVDGGRTGVMGLGVELKDTVAGLGQSSGATDDALQLQAGDQR